MPPSSPSAPPGWPSARRVGLIANLYYAALYGPVAVLITFFPLWLRDQGMSEHQVGLLLAAGTLMRVVSNPLFGHLADRSGRRKALLLRVAWATAIAATFYWAADSFTALLVVTLAVNLFSASLIPLSESVVLATVERHRLDFGRVRGWGSGAVVVLALLLGLLVEGFGSAIVISVLVAAYAVQALIGHALPETPDGAPKRPRAPLLRVLALPGFALLLASGGLVQAAHGFFYAYSTFYWLESGLSAGTIGWLWSLGVLAEILLFALSARLFGRWSAPAMIALAALGGILRWALLGSGGGLAVAVAVQLLQGLTLGLNQVAVARYLTEDIPRPLIASGTGLYFAIANGVMMAACMYGGGLLFGALGGGIWFIASALCLLALVAALCLLARQRAAGAVTAPGQGESP